MTHLPSRSFIFAAMLVGLSSVACGQASADRAAAPAERKAPSAEEIDRALAEEIAHRFQGDRKKFLSFLRDQGKTVAEYRREMETRRLQASGGTSVTEPKEEQVHLRLIQLSRRDGETDEQLLARGKDVFAKIKAGAAFADVAKQLSDDHKREKGGDWGWLKRADFKKQFEDVAFSLKAGEVSQPMVLPEGCFLLFVENRR